MEKDIKKEISENAEKPVSIPETGADTALIYNKASENLIEITFVFASLQEEHEKLCDTDSIIWKQMFVDWSNEFETIHSGTDWDLNDYLDEIEKYSKKKILDYAEIKR